MYPHISSVMGKEKHRLIRALTIPGILLLIMWIAKLAETIFGFSLVPFGVHPLHLDGIPGILFSPFVHAGFKHLAANSFPFLILGTALFYFYRKISMKAFLSIWILTGIWIWFGGRDAYHIGASGVIYGLASFLFVSGLIRKDNGLAALALVVIFLYGSLIWGAIPNFLPDKNISWEAHSGGLITGLVMAIYYRKSGPPRKKYLWELEEEEEKKKEQEISFWSSPDNTFPDDTER